MIHIMLVTQSVWRFWDFNYTLGLKVLDETLRKLYCVCPKSQAAQLYSRNKKKGGHTVLNFLKNFLEIFCAMFSLKMYHWIYLLDLFRTIKCLLVLVMHCLMKKKIYYFTKTFVVLAFISFTSNKVKTHMSKY